MKRRYVNIRKVVALAKKVKRGHRPGRRAVEDMALTILQLHAGYERLRAELVRTAPRWSHGPGEWQSFSSDDVPRYPVIIHTHGSGRWL